MLWIVVATDSKQENVLVINYEYLLKRGRFGIELWCDYDIKSSDGMMKWMDVKSASELNLISFKHYTHRQLNYGVGRIILKFIGVYVIVQIDFIADSVYCGYAQYIKEEPGDVIVNVQTELDDKVNKLNKRLGLLGEEPIYYTDGLRILENRLSVEDKDCRSLKLTDMTEFIQRSKRNLSDISFIENPNCTCVVKQKMHKLDYVNAGEIIGNIECYDAGNLKLNTSRLRADKLYCCTANTCYNLEKMGIKVLRYGSIITYKNNIVFDLGNLDIPVHKGAFMIQNSCIIYSKNKNMITRLSKIFHKEYIVDQNKYAIYLSNRDTVPGGTAINTDDGYIDALITGEDFEQVDVWRGRNKDDLLLIIGFDIDVANNSYNVYGYSSTMNKIAINIHDTDIMSSLKLSKDMKMAILEASRRLDRAMAVYGGYRDGMGKVSK